MIKCFTCAKCNQRFATSHLCKLHIIQHLRREQKPAETNETNNGESSSSFGGVEAAADEHKENKETTEDFEDELISSFMREESSTRDKSGSIIEHVVSELSRRGSHGGLAKLPEEKHSHTVSFFKKTFFKCLIKFFFRVDLQVQCQFIQCQKDMPNPFQLHHHHQNHLFFNHLL